MNEKNKDLPHTQPTNNTTTHNKTTSLKKVRTYQTNNKQTINFEKKNKDPPNIVDFLKKMFTTAISFSYAL